MSPAVDLRDRVRGCLVGLAVGDALGHPTEFISSVARIQATYGARGIVDFASTSTLSFDANQDHSSYLQRGVE